MKITKWKYTLTSSKRRNWLWIMENILELSETLNNGDYRNLYIVPRMKLKNYTQDTNIFDTTQDYTKKDLEEILNEEILKLWTK